MMAEWLLLLADCAKPLQKNLYSALQSSTQTHDIVTIPSSSHRRYPSKHVSDRKPNMRALVMHRLQLWFVQHPD